MPRLKHRRDRDVEALMRLLVTIRDEQRATSSKLDGLRKFVFAFMPKPGRKKKAGA